MASSQPSAPACPAALNVVSGALRKAVKISKAVGYSTESLKPLFDALRTARATSTITVSSSVAARAAPIVLALEVHEQLNNSTGRPHHFLGEAIASAKNDLSPGELRSLRRIKADRDVATHSWPARTQTEHFSIASDGEHEDNLVSDSTLAPFCEEWPIFEAGCLGVNSNANHHMPDPEEENIISDSDHPLAPFCEVRPSAEADRFDVTSNVNLNYVCEERPFAEADRFDVNSNANHHMPDLGEESFIADPSLAPYCEERPTAEADSACDDFLCSAAQDIAAIDADIQRLDNALQTSGAVLRKAKSCHNAASKSLMREQIAGSVRLRNQRQQLYDNRAQILGVIERYKASMAVQVAALDGMD